MEEVKIDKIFKEYNEVEFKIQRALAEQPIIQAEREMIKREVKKKIEELKELGITFTDREELEKTYKETLETLNNSLDSLKRKLSEYEDLKEELDNNYEENNQGGIY